MFPAGSSQGLVEGVTSVFWFGLRGHCHRSLVSLAPSMDFTGTALTGFLIAHDCGHRSFKTLGE